MGSTKDVKKSSPSTPEPGSTPTTSSPASAVTSRTSTPTPGASAPTSAVPDGKAPDDSSKLRTFLGILKKFIGVADIAAVRFSLPAQLMEPIPNLEYWHYLDRPEAFVAIGDSQDELGRMLGCLRFWFTKDLKYVKGKPCKPYNSTLGEFFRCQFEVEDSGPTVKSLKGEETKPSLHATPDAPQGDSTKGQKVKVSYLTEQTSHHPPVSAYYVDCPDKGISARGFDQLSAKFTGTSVRVVPGAFNEGIYVTLHRWNDETYHLTHPAAYLGGFLRGNLYVTVSDICFVTCPNTNLRVILHYLEEGYFGKVQNKVEGIVYKCADATKDPVTKLKDVQEKDILGRIEGTWTDKVYFSYGSKEFKKADDKDKILLIDVNPLYPAAKICPPLEEQLPNESRRFWNDVTDAITTKQYSRATTVKQELEEKQREKARERAETKKEWKPRFFTAATEPKGKPELSEEGRAAMDGLHEGRWHLEPPEEYGAF